MRKAVAILCLLLGTYAASAAAEKAPSTWFKDYIGGSKAKAQSGYYEEIEKLGVNFRAVSGVNVTSPPCLDNGTCPAITNTWSFVAIEEHEDYYKGYGSDSFADQGIVEPLTKCFITWNPTSPVALATKTGVSWIGTFYGTCHLGEDRKGVLPETCDDTILALTGNVYSVEKAVRVGPPSGALGPQSARRASTKSAEPQYYKERVVEVEPANLPTGSATVFSGPFTVFSDSHPLKYKTGHAEFSAFPGGSTPNTTAQDAHGLLRLGDYTLKLEFVGEGKSRY